MKTYLIIFIRNDTIVQIHDIEASNLVEAIGVGQYLLPKIQKLTEDKLEIGGVVERKFKELIFA